MLQKIVTKWKYTESDVDGTSVYHNKANANNSSSVIDGDFQSGFPTRFIWTKDEVWQKEVLNHIAQNR